ncbi:MAG: RecQ family ATP-dependent DNA helicase [Bacteroidaceae bacterium]|nr:RecQ family ATP-dependent DNA helicase [Bacteroidaceae bacterium]
MSESVYLSVLKEYFGYDSFRGIQQEIIESIGAGRDTLGLMPTGGGKSITFQVPALAKEGLCLVISPLIALMKDQVEHLRQKGIKSVAIYTGMSRDEVIVALENCIYGNFKFLYVSPERLSSELFLSKLRRMHVSFIAVDEAHCISQWGYDFRPSYLAIAQVRQVQPNAPVLALTATATPAVVKDIQKQLQFSHENVFRMSFERKNLIYSVRLYTGTQEQEVKELLQEIEGCSIVYVRSRKGARELAEWLSGQGILATFYHAGLTNKEKNERARAWKQGDIRVMVATNAFGMGIDKPDVRSVIHADVPDSPEAYFQEAGRAGRDGQPAHAILLRSPRAEAILRRRIDETYPPEEYVVQVYEDMCCFLQMAIGDGFGVTREFSLDDFCRNFRHYPVRAYNALQLLSRAGYIEWVDAEENQSRVMITCRRDELYGLHIPSTADRLLGLMLRSYTGIFSEYAFIDENRMAMELGVTEAEVSEALITLSRAHILNFIPRKFIPYVTFTQRRLDNDEIILPRSIYADRRRELEQRIQTIIGYLHTDECRSRYFLNYFGEGEAQDCGHCDNCIGNQTLLPGQRPMQVDEKEDIRQRILELFRQQGRDALEDLHLEGVADRKVAEVLHQMLLEEDILAI